MIIAPNEEKTLFRDNLNRNSRSHAKRNTDVPVQQLNNCVITLLVSSQAKDNRDLSNYTIIEALQEMLPTR